MFGQSRNLKYSESNKSEVCFYIRSCLSAGVVGLTYNSSTWEAEAAGSKV
jgi:hypothetical protein